MKKFLPALVLFLVAVLAYGLLSLRLGFYWDDLPITWIRYTLGSEALTSYFSTNRPVWGLLHQVTTRLIPQVPAYWQVFALVWRWLGAVVVYLIVAKLWKDRGRLALGVSLLFLVYPGFNQHWAAYLYSHFYIVLFFFLVSFLCMLLAIESPRRFWAWTAAGLFFSALNLWMMEYFYVLELMRVGFILTALRDEDLTLLQRLKRTLSLWAPYLAVFTLAVLSRLFIFNNQVYGISLTSQLRSAPLETLIALARNIKKTLELVLRDAWLKIFELPDMANADAILSSYYLVVAVAVIVAIAGFLLVPRDAAKTLRKNVVDGIWMIGLGGLAVLLAGWPFWLIGFTPSLNWPASRFTLPFMLGVALIFAGFISLIPWEKLRIVLLVSLVSMAAGKQYLTSHDYLQDWETQKNLFWQMTWRAPSIAPDTLLLVNEGAFDFYADNSLSAALNWIYAPDNHSSHIEYVLFHPTTRFKNALPDIETEIPIYYDYLAGEFNGNTSKTLSFYYAPPGCLRLLDPEVERVNRLIPENSLMRYAARLTDPKLILEEPRAVMPAVYGPEPEHGFCYYYQKADLARQFGAWEKVAEFADIALSFEDHPYEPAEQLVFIEGYAHAGQWERALDLSEDAYEFSPEFMGRVICQLWERIGAETGESPERSEAFTKVQSMFACSP
ncbi:MAG: hypothetical protein HGA79_04495 [Anaerolineales bacterium]|nr:hypothetical protein [Anaerolineales bacterium]